MNLTIEADEIKVMPNPTPPQGGLFASKRTYLVIELLDIEPEPLYEAAKELDLEDLMYDLLQAHGEEAIMEAIKAHK